MAIVVDLAGRKFGGLLVIRRGPSVASGASWECKCACGEILFVAASNLRRGQICCKECSNRKKRRDLVGATFGRLVVSEFSHTHLAKAYWKCRCECGTETTVLAQSLTDGKTLSCGCLLRERVSERSKTHGLTEHPLYDAWVNMRQRCLNQGHKHYGRYGGRGVSISEPWNDFQAFYTDMMPTWSKGLTLERIDVNGDYSKENCEWIVRPLQTRNMEKTIRVDLKGRSMTLPEVAERYGLNQHTLWYRWKNGKVGDELIKPPKRNTP